MFPISHESGPLCPVEVPESVPTVSVPGRSDYLFPCEFMAATGKLSHAEVHEGREKPSKLLRLLRAGKALVLEGSYAYVDGIFRYCQRQQRNLVADDEARGITDRAKRKEFFSRARRQRLHRLLVMAKGDRLLHLEEPPDTTGLQEWFDEPTGEHAFLIPVRRLQRILTDMRRAAEGLHVRLLGGTMALLPQVYVPSDESVPNMFAEYAQLMRDKCVMDMGTGTGILALLAAKWGAGRVVATDVNPQAVANAELNIERFNLQGTVEARGPAYLFSAVQGERFDVILFNAPWIQGVPQTRYETALYDPGYHTLDTFLQSALAHLTQDGTILLQYSDISQWRGDNSIEHLESVIQANGLHVAQRQGITRRNRLFGTREHVYLYEIHGNAQI